MTSTRLLGMFATDINITILERPVRVPTLFSSVRAAIRARRWQYEVRDYLAERRKTQEQLLQKQRMESLGVLAGGIAHDFNNLLTGILGNASLALDTLQPGAAANPFLEEVVQASERAAHLTKQLLVYAGKGRFFLHSVDLSALVRDVSRLIQTSIPNHVRLRLELGEGLPCLQADGSQIQQLVMNLIINAAEAIPDDRAGQVVVSTRTQHVTKHIWPVLGPRRTSVLGSTSPSRSGTTASGWMRTRFNGFSTRSSARSLRAGAWASPPRRGS